MQVCTDIHDPQRVKPNDFDDPLTFFAAPPAGESFRSSIIHLPDELPQTMVQIDDESYCL